MIFTRIGKAPAALAVVFFAVAGWTSDALAAFVAPTWSMSFSQSTVSPGDTVTLTFTIDATAASGGGDQVKFTDDLNAFVPGAVSVSGTKTGFCDLGSGALSGTSTLTVTGMIIQLGHTCTFSVDVKLPSNLAPGTYTNVTSDLTGLELDTTNPFDVAALSVSLTVDNSGSVTPAMITDFLRNRGKMILMHEPDRRRRIQRLVNGGAVAAQTPNVGSDPSVAITGKLGSFDTWTELDAALFGEGGAHGGFGVAYAGADKLVQPNLLLGLMTQVDYMRETKGAATQSALGVAVGPYATWQIMNGLFLDTRTMVGTGVATVNPIGTFTDTYNVHTWLIHAALEGDINSGRLTLAPEASATYLMQDQPSFTSATTVRLPGQTVGTARLGGGLGVRYDAGTFGNASVELRGKAEIYGLFDWVNAVSASTDIRGRIQLGTDFVYQGGQRLELSTAYDGFSTSGFQSVSARLKFSGVIN